MSHKTRPGGRLGADRGVLDVRADVDSSEHGYDVECEGVTHGIYRYVFNLNHEE